MVNQWTKVPKLNNVQLSILVLLRVLIGWHLLYEGLAKVTNSNWTSAYYLEQSGWLFSGVFNSIAESSFWLPIVDFTNQWLLVVVGTFLILGLLTRTSAFIGASLLFIYYLAQPPLFEAVSMQADGNNLIVNKVLIESIALVCLAVIPTGKFIGLDRVIYLVRRSKKNV